MEILEKTFGLKGRNALITGSGRGIGATIARAFVEAGAHVILHAQSSASLKNIEAELEAYKQQIFSLPLQLSAPDAGKNLIETGEKMAGKIDILVINASAQINADLSELTMEDFDMQVNVNMRATIQMLQTCLPKMAARGWGRVVNIGSVNQYAPKGIVTAYAATKAAQHNFIQSQARDYAQNNVLLNTLSPGLINTDRNAAHKQRDDWQEYQRNINWLGRVGEPEEMVGAALFLASDACSFMTGETMNLTGG